MLIAIGLGAVAGHAVVRNAMRRGLGQLPPVHVGMGALLASRLTVPAPSVASLYPANVNYGTPASSGASNIFSTIAKVFGQKPAVPGANKVATATPNKAKALADMQAIAAGAGQALTTADTANGNNFNYLRNEEGAIAAVRTNMINAWNDFLTLGIYQKIGNNATIQQLSTAMSQLASGKYSLTTGGPSNEADIANSVYHTIQAAATAYISLINRLP